MLYNKKNFSALALILAMSVSLAGISYAQDAALTDNENDADELGITEEQNTPSIALEDTTSEVADSATQNDEANQDSDMGESNVDKNNEGLDIPLENSEQSTEESALPDDNGDSVFPDDMPLLSPDDVNVSGDTQTSNTSAELSNAEKLGESVLAQIDNELFAQMSDIEKQTTLLSLELRREKIKSEIAAIQAQRLKAFQEQEDEREAREQKKKDMKSEKEIQILKEQQVLKDREIALEALRQEKALNDYKNKMLEINQKWIEENQKLYDTIQRLEEERKSLVTNFIDKLSVLNEVSISVTESAETALANYNKTVSNLNLQNSQLRKRLDAETSVGTNPFSGEDDLMNQNTINKDYVVMEIRGKGADLVAKLINKKGETFLVRQGTVLQSGHSVEKITNNFIVLDKKGIKNYLQFTASGVVDQEPVQSDVLVKAAATRKATSEVNDDNWDSPSAPTLLTDDGVSNVVFSK